MLICIQAYSHTYTDAQVHFYVQTYAHTHILHKNLYTYNAEYAPQTQTHNDIQHKRQCSRPSQDWADGSTVDEIAMQRWLLASKVHGRSPPV